MADAALDDHKTGDRVVHENITRREAGTGILLVSLSTSEGIDEHLIEEVKVHCPRVSALLGWVQMGRKSVISVLGSGLFVSRVAASVHDAEFRLEVGGCRDKSRFFPYGKRIDAVRRGVWG